MSLIATLLDFVLHIDTHLADIISTYGTLTYAILFAIIFGETGLVIAPFLPGDSLLFVTGVFAAQGTLNIWILASLLFIAAILGDATNYALGHNGGTKIFGKFIRQEHIKKTENFFAKHGAKAIVLARFMPIIRTVAPFVAGIGSMNYRTFLIYNITGAFCWVGFFLFGGYFFGNIPFVQDNLAHIIYAIVIISIIPALVEYLRHKRNN